MITAFLIAGLILFPSPITRDPSRPRMKGDLDNYNKIMFDALQGLVYENDNQIVEIHSFRKDDKHNPRVELLVHPSEGYE